MDCVGLDNYNFVFTDDSMLRSMRNTARVDHHRPALRGEHRTGVRHARRPAPAGRGVAKSMIFLPMAISFVGAAVTCRLIYSFRPEGFGTNIGLLNGDQDRAGQEPVAVAPEQPWNNLLLMVIMVWMQTGFAMVVLSAAIKSIPEEIIEAARIDGASELQVFRRIIVPSILPTIVVVTTYMVINALKVFDIVFVMGERRDERHRGHRRADDPVVLHQQPRRSGGGHRRDPVRRDRSGDDLEHPPLPRARGDPMTLTAPRRDRQAPAASRRADRRAAVGVPRADGSSGSRSSSWCSSG